MTDPVVTTTAEQTSDIAAIVIGRNEGDRLIACLSSLDGQADQIVYVDSGSTDDSLAVARAAGARVVELDLAQPFTAARARNAGRAELGAQATAYLQFVDGDCEMRAGWLETAQAFLDANPEAAVACGRRRERFSHASIYNQLCDAEWDTPVGEALACGGDALMRTTAFDQVGGFRMDLIAGEEPELCLRLRKAGWTVHRLAAEMTLHDAAITRVSQWWNRAKRAGHAFAEGAALHGAPPECHWVRERNRVLIWGIILPFGAVIGGLIWWPLFLALLAFPAQILRLALKGGGTRFAWLQSFFTTLGKVAEGQGMLKYYRRRLTRGEVRLMEYK